MTVLKLSLLMATAWSAFQESLASIRNDVGRCQTDVSDVIFSQNLLWKTVCDLRTQCAVTCMFDPLCISFIVASAPSTGKTACWGYSVSTHDPSSSTSFPGARLYHMTGRTLVSDVTTGPASADVTTTAVTTTTTTVTTTTTEPTTTERVTTTEKTTTSAPPWHQTTCGQNWQCTASNSVCFSGKCLCSPGYYYSISADACIASCASSDLQNGMVAYPLRFLLGYNLIDVYETLQGCQSLCVTNPNCRSLDFRHLNGRCTTSSMTPLGDPGAWKTSDNYQRLYYYQRMCA